MGPGDGRAQNVALSGLGGVLLNEETVEQMLSLVAEVAERALASAWAVSVTRAGSDGPYTSTATDPRVRDLDAVQYATGQGPCVESLSRATQVEVLVTSDGSRYAEFSSAARQQGVGRVLSVPMVGNDGTIGSLNIYSRDTGSWSEDEARTARLLAADGAAGVSCALAYNEVSVLAVQLQEALALRDLIGQAKGILMKTEDCDANGAFDLLRRASQRTNRKLRDVAADLVAATIEKGP